MNNEDTDSWIIQTHEERELVAAENIIYFSRSPRRNINCTQLQIHAAPHLTTDTANTAITEPHSATSVNSSAKHLIPEKAASKTSAFASLLTAASAAQIVASGSGPRQSASYVEHTAFHFEQADIPKGGAEIPMDPDYSGFPVTFRPFRANLTPVTNVILAAIAAGNEIELPPSVSRLFLPPFNSNEIGAIHLRGIKEMRDFIVESRRSTSMQDTDISSSSSSIRISHSEELISSSDDTQAGMEEDNCHEPPDLQDHAAVDFIPHYQNEVIVYGGTEVSMDDEETHSDLNDDGDSTEIEDTKDGSETGSSTENEDKPRQETNTPRWTEGDRMIG